MSTYAKSTDAFRCDECGEDMAVPLFCDHCATNYPERRAMGPFSVLGLEERWDHDDDVFEARELALAARLHPDRWQSRGDRAHKQAQLAWSAVNEALAKTADPFVRAQTLLERDDPDGGEQIAVPQAFLLEQLELQEEIEDGVDSDRRKTLSRAVRRELKELRRQLAGHFEVLDAVGEAGSAAGDADAAARHGAWVVVHKSRYWKNAQRALRAGAAQARL